MFRLLLLALALCHAVFAFPQEADKKELAGDLELLQRVLERQILQGETEPNEELKRSNGIPTGQKSASVTLVYMVNPRTEQSSTLTFRDTDFISGNAVDKNFNSDLINGGSCAHTEAENNPWWKVHLRESHCIAQVGIVNRWSGQYERLTGAVVRVGGIDGPTCGAPISAKSANIPAGINIVYCEPPIAGDEITVHIPRDGATLQICEVMIWEVPMEHCK